MKFENAKYMLDLDGNKSGIQAIMDAQEVFIPLDEANRHHSEIMRQAADGTLVIQDADPVVQADEPALGPSIDELTSRIAALEDKSAKTVRK